ncbi:hypothetical protein BDZ89DRAFT_1046771 [Hymenopellis radicata]|nr:hypothetical protein BDZ89DRAFT_1046771 [Hymenopellis radicata]
MSEGRSCCLLASFSYSPGQTRSFPSDTRQEQRAGSMFPSLGGNLALSKDAQTREKLGPYFVSLDVGQSQIPLVLVPTQLTSRVLQDQYVAVINDTNTSKLDTGVAGSLTWISRKSKQDVQLHLVRSLRLAVAAPRESHEPHTHGSADPPTMLEAHFRPSTLSARLFISRVKHPAHLNGHPVMNINRGGNLGLLSIGPVESDSLSWIPTYASAWEVFLDAVYFGRRLPDSQLADSTTQNSARIDTGDSLIRRLVDIIHTIYTQIGGTEFLTFEIGGKMFPVDPRDFISQADADSTDARIATIAVTDTPQCGQAICIHVVWTPLCVSFPKSHISFQDPPSIGFLSTMPEDAAARPFMKALDEANGNLYGNMAKRPRLVFQMGGSTNSLRVHQADTTSASSMASNTSLVSRFVTTPTLYLYI